jgi:hypothetical protein
MKPTAAPSLIDNLKLSYLSSIPAGMMDSIYLEEPQGILGKFTKIIRLRLLFLVFLALTTVDMVTAGLTALICNTLWKKPLCPFSQPNINRFYLSEINYFLLHPRKSQTRSECGW